MFQKTTLKNGLRIITSEMPQMQSVATDIFIGAGSRYENKQDNGISHFLEHMMFKGTKKRPTAKKISQTIESIGGILNAGTSIDWTYYWTLVPNKYFPLGIELLSDIIQNSLFDSKEIKKEAGVIIEEINMYQDNPQVYVEKLIHNLMWKDQNLGLTPLGTKENIKKSKKINFINYLKDLYQPSNMVVSVVGKIKHKRAVEESKKLFGNLKNRKIKKIQKVKEIQKKPAVYLYKKQTDQVHLCLATKTKKLNHFSDSILKTTFDVLNAILSAGMSSRLWLEIREKKGLAYYIHSLVEDFAEVGDLTIFAGLNINKVEEAIKIILNELRKIKEKRVDEKELKKTKEFMKGVLLLKTEDTRSMSSWYGLQELLYQPVQTPEEKIAEIDKVTAADIQRAAREIFRTEKLNLAMIGPFEDEGRFLKLLHC
jgi:predicted Zn-dependent peptidase